MRNLLYIFLFLFIGCSESFDISKFNQEKKEIIEFTNSWAKFTSADEYFNHITEDFIYLGPDSEPITDLDSMYRWIDNISKNYIFSFPDWVSDEIIILDTVAIHRYTGTAYFISKKDSSKSQQYRKYIDILKKTDKGWQISRHMWNRNN